MPNWQQTDPDSREAAYKAAWLAGDVARAHAIAREPCPPDWPEDVRRPWGARRIITRAALRGGKVPRDDSAGGTAGVPGRSKGGRCTRAAPGGTAQ